MVGGDSVDDVVVDGEEDVLAVGGTFDGRVALDARTQCGIHLIGEDEVLRACLAGDAFVSYGSRGEEPELVAGRYVHDVQSCSSLTCELYGPATCQEACVVVANDRVCGNGQISSVSFDKGFPVGGDRSLVFGVDCDEGIDFAENALDGRWGVDKHIAGRGSEEEFYACDIRVVGT